MRDMNRYEDIRPHFVELAKEVSKRAKQEGKMGNTIQITVKEAGTNGNYRSHNKSVTLSNPFNDEETLMRYVDKLYESNFTGLTIRLVGVTLQNLVDIKEATIQMSLFDYEKHIEESATKLLIYELNRKMKKPLLMRASEVKKDGNH